MFLFSRSTVELEHACSYWSHTRPFPEWSSSYIGDAGCHSEDDSRATKYGQSVWCVQSLWGSRPVASIRGLDASLLRRDMNQHEILYPPPKIRLSGLAEFEKKVRWHPWINWVLYTRTNKDRLFPSFSFMNAFIEVCMCMGGLRSTLANLKSSCLTTSVCVFVCEQELDVF